VEPGRVERCRNRETGFMPNPHTIPGAPWPRAIHVLIVGLLAAVLLFMPAGPSLEAAKPAGLGLRLLESSDAADPFSPRNRDGRFDVNTLRVTLGVGPLGPPVRSEPAPGDDPGPIRTLRSRGHWLACTTPLRHLSVRRFSSPRSTYRWLHL
jgi:hypothetical protein